MIGSTKGEQEFDEILHQLTDDYLASVRDSLLPNMKQQWDSLLSTWDTDILRTLHRAAHTMTGTSGSYELHDVSRLTRRIEQHLKHLLTGLDEQPSRIVVDEITQLLRELSALVANHITAAQIDTLEQTSTDTPSIHTPQARELSDVKVALLGDNTDTLTEICTDLRRFGFQAKQLLNPDERPEHDSLDVVVVSCTIRNWPHWRPLVRHCTLEGIPVLVSSDSEEPNFTWRLELIRSGAQFLDPKDLQILLLVRRLYKLLKLDAERPVRAIMLDDDRALLNRFDLLFKQFGIEALLLNNSTEILHAVSEFTPDIFILDLHMPEVTGIEVAQILRPMELFQTTPIVFLSADESLDSKLAIVRHHADDLLSKTEQPRELLLQIVDRAMRGRRLRDLMAKDSLTGLLNHNHILESANRRFMHAKRQLEPMVLIMLDLDHFKTVNDTYGHVTGDQVLLSLSMLLKTQLRQSDLIGRFGGEEFMLVLNNGKTEDLVAKINGILDMFSQLVFQGRHEAFSCTFSAGVAVVDDFERFEDLLLAADKALYAAKEGGRNRVEVAKASQ